MAPKLAASYLEREITFLASELSAWMEEALGQTPYSTVKLREFFEQGKPLPVADRLGLRGKKRDLGFRQLLLDPKPDWR